MNIPFINREVEVNTLLEVSSRGYYPILYVYGPEGCGKTRLFRELANKLRREGDYLVIYVDALETSNFERAILAPKEIVLEVAKVVGEIAGIGGYIAKTITEWLLKGLRKIKVKSKHIVVMVDDVVQAIGIERVNVYTKKLLDLLEELYTLNIESATIIVSTSEGRSRREILRHRWATMKLLWNLDSKATLRLLETLKAPEEERREYLKLTGGNPRAIIELYYKGWNIEEWKQTYKEPVKTLLRTLDREGYKRELIEVVEDPDRLLEASELLREKLIEYNMVIELPVKELRLAGQPERNLELGVGEEYAWQIPVYRYLIREQLA